MDSKRQLLLDNDYEVTKGYCRWLADNFLNTYGDRDSELLALKQEQSEASND